MEKKQLPVDESIAEKGYLHERKKIDKAIRAQLDMDAILHGCPKNTKADLKKEVCIGLNHKGKPKTKEV